MESKHLVNFETALTALKRGHLVARHGWIVRLSLDVDTYTILASSLEHEVIAWQPTQDDLLANDWLITVIEGAD